MKNIYNYDLLNERVREEIRDNQYESFIEFYDYEYIKGCYIEGLREKEVIFKNLEVSNFDISYSQSDYINLSGYIMSKDLLNFTKKYRNGILEELNKWSSFSMSSKDLDDIIKTLEEEDDESIDIINITSRTIKADTYFYKVKKYVEDLFYMIQVELLNDFSDYLDEFINEEFENYFQDYINNNEFYEDGEEFSEYNKLLLINDDVKVYVNKDIVEEVEADEDELVEVFEAIQYSLELKGEEINADNIEEDAHDTVWEYVDNNTPIYNNQIQDRFNELKYWEVDEILEEAVVEITLENGYISFMQQVLFMKNYIKLNNSLYEIIENLEVVNPCADKIQDLKITFLNYLNSTKDLELEKRIEKYLKGEELSCESILHYIAEIYYISEDGEASKLFNVFVDNLKIFINDEDIKEAIKKY